MGKQLDINGATKPAFASVRKLFQREMDTMLEENAQLCVYYRGEKVVDLWASPVGDSAFHADSLVNVFSSGKSLECIALAALVSRGLLSYDDRIAKHWPEFAQNGKADLTVADLMRHEAGLANLDVPLPPEDLYRANIKRNRIGAIIERMTARFPGHTDNRREYHTVTRGWIANELFRRVDPAGRTIGEFFAEDICTPLEADVLIGVPEERMERRVPVSPLGFGRQLLESLKPRFLKRGIVHNFFQIIIRLFKILPAMRKGSSTAMPPPFEGMTDIGFFNDPRLARGETPSATANGSARGLARLAALMAAQGQWQGREFLSQDAWHAMHAEPHHAELGALMPTRFTQGGVCQFVPCGPDTISMERAFNEGREGFFGWMGLGGSVFQWHPGLQIGFAFVPTSLHVLDLLNERGKRYQAEVLACIERLGQPPGAARQTINPASRLRSG